MSLILSGTNGLSDVDGSAATPAIRGTDTDTGIFFPAANTLAFSTNGTEDARFDSAGNFGLGVTPSAWGTSAYRAIQIGKGGAAYANTNVNTVGLTSNYYNSGSGDIYISNDYATRYYQYLGQHVWNVAPSGTAGNAISFTQAMTLDASGSLLVNNTSNDGFRFKVTDGGGNVARFTNGATQTMDVVLDASGFTLQNPNNGYIAFKGSSTERGRFDSSGNLLLNTTSSRTGTNSISIEPTGNCYIELRKSGSGSSTQIQFNRNTDTTPTNAGSISTTGTTTSYNTSSDYRLKHDIQPITGALVKVAALKPVTYKWNTDNSSGEGFIAHELAEVCPDAVHGEKDAVDEDGNPKYQGIDTSFLVATLTAAIQEQQAIITQLQADVAALKGAQA